MHIPNTGMENPEYDYEVFEYKLTSSTKESTKPPVQEYLILKFAEYEYKAMSPCT